MSMWMSGKSAASAACSTFSSSALTGTRQPRSSSTYVRVSRRALGATSVRISPMLRVGSRMWLWQFSGVRTI